MARRLAPPEDYERCAACGTWRPGKETFKLESVTVISSEGERPVETKSVEHRCVDRAWCDLQRTAATT